MRDACTSIGIQIPEPLATELESRGPIVGVSLLRDLQRIKWHYTGVPNVERGATGRLGKAKAEKIMEDLKQPDMHTLFVYSDAGFRVGSSAAGIHITTPTSISQSISLGSSLRASEEAELAGLLWSMRFVRSWLESEEGVRTWQNEGYKNLAFVTDASASIHYLSGRMFYKRHMTLERLRLVAECRIEAGNITRLTDNIYVHGVWVPRDFDEHIIRAHNLSECAMKEAVWHRYTTPRERYLALEAINNQRWEQLSRQL